MTRHLISVIIALCAVGCVSATVETCCAAEAKLDLAKLNQQVQEVVKRVKPACVSVAMRSKRGMNNFSGVIVSKEGHILTVAHCIKADTKCTITLADGTKLSAKSLGRSRCMDCGMLKITTKDARFSWVELGDSTKLAKHQPCISFGHPHGFQAKRGLVLRFGRIVGRNARWHIHNTCLMEPGDSGGGLFDLQGRLIGVRSYIGKDLTCNYDVPVNRFRDHWKQLCEPRDFHPSWTVVGFGITLKAGLAGKNGAEIASVQKNSPADQAGLQAGDRIVSLQKKKLTEGLDVAKALKNLSCCLSHDVRFGILRAKKSSAVVIKKYVPKSPAVSNGVAQRYAGLVQPEKLVSGLETKLDDCVVTISSQRNGKALAALGTIVSRDGLVVTKSTRVDASPKVTVGAQKAIPAKIVLRDSDNDLVLLRVDRRFASAVKTGGATRSPLGSALIAPRPEKEAGLLGVVGSRCFASSARKMHGYLGATPALQDKTVVLKKIAGGPAKEVGLRKDDVILKIDDKEIKTPKQLNNILRSHLFGDRISIKIQRGKEQKVIEVTLSKRPPAKSTHVTHAFPGGKSDRLTGFTEVFCHDAHLEPTQCGGPLFDLSGNFIGITIARVGRTHCYALTANVIHQFLEDSRKQAAESKTSPKNVSMGAKHENNS